MKSGLQLQRFNRALVFPSVLICLNMAYSQLQAKEVTVIAGDEKELGNFIKAKASKTKTITLKKGSHITLTKDHFAGQNNIGFDGQIDPKSKDPKANRPVIDGGDKHSIRLGSDNTDLDFIRNIAFEHGNETESDIDGGAFYIPGDIRNGIENSHFTSNQTKKKSGGAIYVGGDLIGNLDRSQFKNNKAEWGGGLYVQGDFEGGILNSHFEDNHVGQGGGAVYIKGLLSGGIIGSQFKNNIAFGQFGGAVYVGSLEGGVAHSRFIDNASGWSGAAIFADDTFSGGITTSVFLNNQVMASSGGAIGVTNFEGDIESTRFEKNEASHQGGAIYVYEDFVGDIVTSIFKDNLAGMDGGALYISDTLQGGIYGNSLFENNKAERQGGAIFVGNIEGNVGRSRFVGNQAKEEGGAIFIDETMTGDIIESIFEKNSASDGGAIYINDGHLDGAIERSEFDSNIAVNNGGALYGFGLEKGIAASAFYNNEAGEDGGAIHILGSLKGGIGAKSSFIKNIADGSGGAAYISDFRGGIENSYFSSNEAGEFGGALYVDQLSGGINTSSFEKNSAESGGAIYASTLKGGISNSLFDKNTARELGGALYISDLLKGNIRNSQFTGNSATDGGAIYADDQIKGNISNSFFRDNYADYLGGALFVKELNGEIKKSVFTNNSVAGWGGAIYMGGIFHGGISNSIFVKNQASFDSEHEQYSEDSDPMGLGGAIFSYGKGSGNRTITNSIFLGNAARSNNKADNYGGLGGAIFHNATITDGASSSLTIEATSKKSTIFYGNRSRQSDESEDRANAIYLGNMGQDDRKTQVNIKAEEGGTIFMFDPLESQKDGVIDGTGEHYGNLSVDLHKTGKGSWFLGDASVMHGASTWSIDEGALLLTEVDGVKASISLEHEKESRFTLGAGGTIAGSGTITAREINFSGMIDPSSLQKTGMGIDDIRDETNVALGATEDSYYGIITLETQNGGNIALENATYALDIGDDNHDLIIAKGDLHIDGGMVEVRSHISVKDEETGLYKEDSHVIIDSEGKISGQFGAVHDDMAFWDTRLDYVDNQVILRFVRDLNGATKNCSGHNQCQISEIVNNLGDSHKITGAIIDMKTDELGRAYDNLSGEIYASSRTALLGNNHLYRTLNQRMLHRSQISDKQPTEKTSSGLSPIWFSAFTHDGYYTGQPHTARLDSTGHGMTVGFDRADTDGFLGGFLLGHEAMRLTNGAARNSRSDADLYHIGAYLGGKIAGLHLSGGVIYQLIDIKTERDIWVAGTKTSLAGTAKSDSFGHKLQFFGEVAKDFGIDSALTLTLSPYLQLSQNYLRTAATHESGSAAALDIAAATDALFSTTAGLRGFYDSPARTSVRFYADIGWQHSFGAGKTKSRHHLHDTHAHFDIEGTRLERDTAFIGAGVNAALSDTGSVEFGYQGQFGYNTIDHSVNLQLKFNF